MGPTIDVTSMLHYSIYFYMDYCSLLDHKHFGQRVHKLQLLIELKIVTSKCANYESEVLQKEVLKILL